LSPVAGLDGAREVDEPVAVQVAGRERHLEGEVLVEPAEGEGPRPAGNAIVEEGRESPGAARRARHCEPAELRPEKLDRGFRPRWPRRRVGEAVAWVRSRSAARRAR
jgi:hypothetical protein